MAEFYEKLLEVVHKDHIKAGEEMKRHTTFRAGGPAAWFVTPEKEEELCGLLLLCRQEGMPVLILGNGSNLLVGDKGFDGVVVSMELFSECRADSETGMIKAGAGALLARIAKEALRASLTGFEFAAGIPGTLGGAVVMNAGAYGSEMKDVLHSVTVLTAEGQILTLPASELCLDYRKSCILERGYTVLSASILLKPGEREAIEGRMKELAARRREKQPLEYPSAGSTFKRPAGYFAGKLIEEAGLKGFSIGGAQVSEKHCGFVINRENATAADIKAVCEAVRERVYARFGVKLELEVKTFGKF